MTDVEGVVFSVALDGNGAGSPLNPEALPGTGGAWLHLDYSASGSQARLKALGLPTHVVNTLTRLESRPHTTPVGDGLMVILRGINRNAGADPEDMVSLRAWLEKDRLVTVRQRPVRAAQSLHQDVLAGNGPESPAGLLVELIKRLIDGVAMFVDDVETRMEHFEELVETEAPGDLRAQISELRRQVAAVRRYLAPERDALETLIRIAATHMSEAQVYALREQSDRITRYVEDLDLVREQVLVTQEELMNRVAQEQNTRTYLLTVVAAVFLPLTFLSGVFGMNTAGLPGLEDPMAFWWVSGAMAITGVVVTIWLRLKKWF